VLDKVRQMRAGSTPAAASPAPEPAPDKPDEPPKQMKLF
jgi:hypothetical protein